ncbi:hypothetical protein AB0F52_48390 [Amycolatopsis sp. NPDC024027]|uniref:hypothetical protein n=1 Tax=Amycolatopsis sp. NPDC024027 TaxID=3154327 RepID=UPI0033F4C801
MVGLMRGPDGVGDVEGAMSFEPVEPERPAQQRDGSPKLRIGVDRKRSLIVLVGEPEPI